MIRKLVDVDSVFVAVDDTACPLLSNMNREGMKG